MATDLEVHGTRRVVLVKFVRAATGDPDPDAPDPDERGYGAPERGPVIGITQGRTINVMMVRTNIDSSAPLFVASSDTAVMTIADPAGGNLPNDLINTIRLTGVDGGTTDLRRARMEVHFGSATGPVISRLHVRVYRPLDVDITPHFVSIGQTGSTAAAVPPAADVDAIMTLVRAIWIHHGVTFTVAATQNTTISLSTAGIVQNGTPSGTPDERPTLLADNWPDGTPNWVEDTINVYFVNQIGTAGVLGYGFSRESFARFGMPNPGILLGDRTATSARYGTMHYGNDLAHEIGHFFRLWHPEQQEPPREREDTWSRRMLMHNHNRMWGRDPWPRNDASGAAYVFRPRFDDAGYGVRRRGCMVTMKNLSQLNTDGEEATARGTITSAAGPY